MAKKADIPKTIIDSAMALAAEKRWRDLSLAEIAEAAKLPLTQVHAAFPSKQAILNGLSRQVDAEMLAGLDLEAEAEGGAKDRLFDVIMSRFDALAPYRQGLGNVVYDQARDPLAAVCSLTRLYHSMALSLEAARISASGMCGLLRAKGLGAIYLDTLRVWLRDDSADMAKTMAALDRRLRQIDGLLGRFPRRRASPSGA